MEKVYRGDISKRLFFYLGLMILFFLGGFLLSSYIVHKSFHYGEIINMSGKIRGNVQRYAKLYFAGDRQQLRTVAVEIDHCLAELRRRVCELALPLIDDDDDLEPAIVQSCWKSLRAKVETGAPKEEILNASEYCWFISNEQTLYYQKLAQRNLAILKTLYYSLFVITVVIFVLLLRLNVGEVFKKLEQRAHFDPLTGALNREAFKEIFERASREELFLPLSLIVFDLDNFKSINDTFGHAAGDEVLKKVAQAVRQSLRKGDVLARWGGEEFVILLPNTDAEGARTVAEKLRKALPGLKIEAIGSRGVTASFGVTEVKPGESLYRAFVRADEALYRAKKGGKNRTEVA